MSRDDPWIGKPIANYTVERVLAEGGMGVVLVGRHRFLDDLAAIKLVRPDARRDPDAPNRLLREARAARRIRHPAVCAVLDFGETEGGDFYLAMELVEGRTLDDLIHERGRLHERTAARLGTFIAEALAAIHHEGVVHRDLKPSNVMLVEGDEAVKIIDFGIARLTEPGQTLTQTGFVSGTPDYMAPEQATGERVDWRADIYAFGILLFEMVTGRRPFGDPPAGPVATLFRHTTEPPPRPSKLARISPEMESLILGCLEKDPERRPQGMREIVDRLARLSGLLPVHDGHTLLRPEDPTLGRPAEDSMTPLPGPLPPSTWPERTPPAVVAVPVEGPLVAPTVPTLVVTPPAKPAPPRWRPWAALFVGVAAGSALTALLLAGASPTVVSAPPDLALFLADVVPPTAPHDLDAAPLVPLVTPLRPPTAPPKPPPPAPTSTSPSRPPGIRPRPPRESPTATAATVGQPLLEEGLERYNRGDYAAALDLFGRAVRSGGGSRAWGWYAAAACELRRREELVYAWSHVVESDRAMVRAACAHSGFELP